MQCWQEIVSQNRDSIAYKMAKSDIDEAKDAGGVVDIGETLDLDGTLGGSTIHSGHFMVSSIDDSEDNVDKNGAMPGEPEIQPEAQGFDFESAVKETSITYKFGSGNTGKLGIDDSLTELFECMTLAYSGGKLTSPKWKNFKGVRLHMKDKIRLNNIIWREWHMQYIGGQKSIICHFEPPISDKTHTKPEAVVLEGKYWKRRLESVTAEYKKWRMYHKEQVSNLSAEDKLGMLETAANHKWDTHLGRQHTRREIQQLPMMLDLDEQMMEDLGMDEFSDTLFSTLNMPFQFPNPREMSGLSNADIIQPGLVQLQPNFYEYMDTLELHEMMSSTNSSMKPAAQSSPTPVPMETSSQMSASSPCLLSGGGDSQLQGPSHPASSPGLMSLADPLHGSRLLQEAILASENERKKSSTPAAAAATTTNGVAVALSDIKPVTLPSSMTNLSGGGIINVPGTVTTVDQGPMIFNTPPTVSAGDGSGTGGVINLGSLLGAGAPSQIISLVLSPNGVLQQQPQPTTLQLQQQQPQQPQQVQATLQHLLGHIKAEPSVDMIQQQQQQQQQQAISMQTPLVQLQQPIAPKNVTPTQDYSTVQFQSLIQGLVQQQQQQQQQQQVSTASEQTIQHTSPLHSQPIVVTKSLSTESVPYLKTAKSSAREGGLTLGSKGLPRSDGDLERVLRNAMVDSRKPATNRRHSQPSRIPEFLMPQALSHPRGGRGGNQVQSPLVSGGTTTTSRPQQNTLLQLLTQNTTSSGPQGSAVKQESPKRKNLTSDNMSAIFTPIRPTPTTTTAPTASVTFSLPSTEFQRKILAAAAPSLGITTVPEVPDMSPHGTPQPGGIGNSNPESPIFQVPSPVSSETGARSRHASSDSAGTPSLLNKDESVAGKGYHRVLDSQQQYKEHRRNSHISAEHKRRINIKSGFEALHMLVPSLNQNPNAKVSKAATLQKGAEYCLKLKQEKSQMQDEADVLRKEVEALNAAISYCQGQLPATGVPVTRQRVDHMREMFDEYVRKRTLENWKFWIFTTVMKSLFETYNTMVSTSSVEDLCRTVLTWQDQHCSLVELRPAALNSLTQLVTSTAILSDPSIVPEQAKSAVQRK